jgi:hypothetical protein
MSGCVNLLVKVGTRMMDGQVIDGVNDAQLTVTVKSLSSPDEVVNSEAGVGYLCVASSYESGTLGGTESTKCGQSVTTETADRGYAWLRYWGPASWQRFGAGGSEQPPPEAYLKLSATWRGSGCGCDYRVTKPPVVASVDINPHLIYERTTVLTNVEFDVLTQWAHAGAISEGIQALAKELSRLKVFDNFSVVRFLERSAKNLKLAGSVADFIILEMFERKFGLVETGLVSKEFNFSQVEGWVLDWLKATIAKNPVASTLLSWVAQRAFGPSNPFDDQMVGLLKSYAGTGPGALSGNPNEENNKHLLTLKVYESSFCTNEQCPPGALPAVLQGGTGVHYNLFFAFSSTDAVAPGTNVFFNDFNVNTQYAAPTWIPAQCDSAAKCLG